MSQQRFVEKVVVVTGAGRGVGQAVALAFAAEGAKVVVNDINPLGVDTTVEQITAAGGQALAAVADVSAKMAVQTFMYAAIEAYGGVDILVNNAGVHPNANLLQMDEFDWDRTLNVNLKGAFLCLQTAARAMVAQGRGGAVVNMVAAPPTPQDPLPAASYQASKQGLIGLTQAAAVTLAEHHIRVNAIAPGVIDTPALAHYDKEQISRWQQAIPLGQQLGQAQDVAGLALFLCSAEAGYITGQTFHINGGKIVN